MRIFISYASEDRRRVEEAALALQADGHEVFFDRTSLAGGDDYNAIIRERIADADLFVFMITASSLEEGSYTLTELRMAREKWPTPVGHVLPVLLEPCDIEEIPAYLRGVTFFEPEGDLAAELAAHLAKSPGRRTPLVLIAAVLVLAIVATVIFIKLRGGGTGNQEVNPPFVSTIEASQFLAAVSLPLDCEEDPSFCVNKTEYTLDSTSRLAEFGADMIRIERVAFGHLAPERSTSAFDITIRLENNSPQPILLDITPRFFELSDDQGRRAELLFFCCEASGEVLEVGATRTIRLIYSSPPGWWGKGIHAREIRFQITGLIPLLRGTWSWPPLATAD